MTRSTVEKLSKFVRRDRDNAKKQSMILKMFKKQSSWEICYKQNSGGKKDGSEHI